MERKRRRLVTVAITAGAVLVIVAAAASSAFQVAVQAVPGYRQKVEQQVRKLTGRPVRIGALGLAWHYYYPSLELINVALLGSDEKTVLLQAERLRLGFGLTRLVRGDFRPNRLELHGLALDAWVDPDGHVAIKGIEDAGDSSGEPLDALQPLTQFAQLRLERCRLNLRDERLGPELYSFGIESAELSRGLLGSDLSAEVALPASIGESARLDVAFTGELLAPMKWAGAGTLELSGLSPRFWLSRGLARGARVDAEGVELNLDGRFDAGRLSSLDLRALSGPLHVLRAGHRAGFDALDAHVAVEFQKDGWRAKLKKLAIESELGLWPATNEGELRATTAGGRPTTYEGRAGFVRVGDLAPWLQVLQVPQAVAAYSDVQGELNELTFRSEGADESLRYSYRGHFEKAGLPARGRTAGVAGAHGEFAGDEHGGRVVLQDGPLTLAMPSVLTEPIVPLDSFEADFEWRRAEGAWIFALSQLRWLALGIRGEGHLDLQVPDDRGVSPQMNLSATFSSPDATRAKPLMPQHWGEGLRGWLDRAILSGSVPKAQLEIRGPLSDFPYAEKKTGVFSLDIEAQGLNLAYQPDWPEINDFDASLHFRGNSLAIETRGGRVSGIPIASASARFPDFQTGQLLIDGEVAGDTAGFYDFLRNSPLREVFTGLLAQTRGAGPARVEIHLDIPVNHAKDSQTQGRVKLDGVQLDYKGLEEPIRDVRGVIDFTPGKVTSEKLTARLWELPLEAQLTPQPERVTLLTATFPLTLDAGGKGASSLVPTWLRTRASGTSRWQARLPLGGDTPSALALSTDLAGVEVRLPPPLGKPAADVRPLTVTIGGAPNAPLRITADYKDRLAADLRFARSDASAPLAFDRGTLRVGAGERVDPKERGISLLGALDTLDAGAWAAELQAPGEAGQGQLIRHADLQIGHATYGRWSLRDARYQWTLTKDGWTINAVGAGAAGAVTYRESPTHALSGKLDALALDELPATQAEAEDGSVRDPTTLPVLDFDVKHLVVGSADLGHVTLLSERTPAGQKLKTLHAEGASITLDGSGEWRRRAGQSSGSLNAELAAKDVGGTLKSFGFSQSLDAKQGRMKGALSWAPSAVGLDWAQAQGTVHLEFENGQLRAVEPGAGRMLGLINFYALPRRLTLNFRDVVSSGLGFDKVNGDFELRDGNATTQNLAIAGPSLRMDVRGRIGLAARDYDQQVNVYPDVSAGVTLGALALGGPVAGVLALIAQQVLHKPLDQVTQLSYRVTGSWDNPQVEKTSAPPPDKPAKP